MAGCLYGLRIFEKEASVTFTNCFRNKNIYSLAGNLNYSGTNILMIDTTKIIADMTYTIANIELCRKQLLDLIESNLQEDEFVEIYSEFISGTNFNLGPPLGELQLMTSELLFSKVLDTHDRWLIEIKK